MEGTTYLEHLALGVSLESGLMEGMSYTEPLEQSVLGECSVTRPEETDTPERPGLASRKDHEQTCVKLSARTMPDTDIVYNADVSTDINTDRLENSAPRISSDSSLFKRNMRPYPPVQNTQGGRPMEGMTESILEELSDLAPAVDCTNKEQLPTSYSLEQSDSSISGNQDYVQNAEGKQFSCDTGLSSPELLEDVIRREVLRNRLTGYRSSRGVEDPLLLPKQVNLCDEEIALDQLRSEGLWQWNMDMDIEYQYETFNGLPVYYGGDMYDSEDTEEFVPNAPDRLECMMYTQRLPDGSDNRSVNAVNMAPMCRTVSKGARGKSDEFSDSSRTDTAELEELDSMDCDIEMDVWEDMDCPVLISDPCVDNSLCLSSQAMSSYSNVAYMGDFADEDFIDTGFDSDMGSEAAFEWNTWNDAHTWES